MDGGSEKGRGALRHPLFWGALALLVINDHVLKGAGVLPGELTGKLSDFAGLIVAPVFVATLFRARTTGTRLLAFAAATLPFVAINVSPAAAAAMETLMGWQIWCDPSDLVGLAALPVAWWLLDARPAELPGRRAVEGVGLIAAGFACMATSPTTPPPMTEWRTVEIPPPDWQTAAHLENDSDVEVDVRLRWVTAEFDCNRIRPNAGAFLTRAAFGEGVTVTLDPRRNFPLNRSAAGAALERPAGWLPPQVGCDAVLVQRDGSSDAIVFFDPSRTYAAPRHTAEGVTFTRPGLVRVGTPGRTSGGDGSQVLVSLLRATLGDDSFCPAAPSVAFAYSGDRVPAGVTATVTSAEMLRDGCFEIGFVADDMLPWTSFLCVPMWALDLAIDDQVRFDQSSPEALFLTRLATDGRPETELRFFDTPVGDFITEDIFLEGESSELCPGAPTACGAYSAPARVYVQGEETHTGEERTGRLTDGRRFRLGIGAAQETVVGIDGCDAAERRPGMQINAVMFIEEVE